MYYIYGVSVPSLLIESTDSMIIHMLIMRCHGEVSDCSQRARDTAASKPGS